MFEKSLPETSPVPPRMRLSRLVCPAIALLLGTSLAECLRAQDSGRPASLSLPRLFANGMVVQRDKPVAVWGWVAPGAMVTVFFRDKTGRSRASKDGAWRVSLQSGKAGGPFELTVVSGAQRIVF